MQIQNSEFPIPEKRWPVSYPVDEVPELRVERRADGEAPATRGADAHSAAALGLVRVVHEERHRLIHAVQRAEKHKTTRVTDQCAQSNYFSEVV